MTTLDTTNYQSGPGIDTRALMMFELNKKEACVAYALWFFVGYFGAHNFYLRRTGVAVVQLLLTLSIVGLVIIFFWHFIDAFLIPGWVRRENSQLAWTLGAIPLVR